MCGPNGSAGDRSSASSRFGASPTAILLIATPFILVRLNLTQRSGVDARFVTNLAIACAITALPALAAGIVVALAISGYPDAVGVVYAFDLVGAALGALLIVPVLWLDDAPTLLVALGIVAAAAGAMFGVAGGTRACLRDRRRSRRGCRRRCLVVHVGALPAAPACRPRRRGEGRRRMEPAQPGHRLRVPEQPDLHRGLLRPGVRARADRARQRDPELGATPSRTAEHRLRARRSGARARDRRGRRPRHLQRAVGRSEARRRHRTERRHQEGRRPRSRRELRLALLAAGGAHDDRRRSIRCSRGATPSTTRSTSVSPTH